MADALVTPRPGWQFWIDRGGTFTDIVARRPDGGLVTRKFLSEAPDQYRDAALHGIRDILDVAPDAPLGDAGIDVVRMGTTVATNALLERHGEPAVLVTTAGFADALRIGYQNRPRLFARHIEIPPVLYDRVIEARERISADGTPLVDLDESRLEADLAAAFADGYRSTAIVFLHAYRQPAHEKRAAAVAARVGFPQVSVSHEVSPLIKLIRRGDTTVADAYLSPLLRRYVDSVASEVQAGSYPPRLLFMQSSGGLTEARRFRGANSILSGPAGGVVGMALTAGHAGFDQVIGFDMGGTSTDVSLYQGSYERSNENEVAGVRISAPMMQIHTVAAGGGSILQYRDERFLVGPESAGANPGPACYRRGGPATVTDANVLLGKLRAENFPRVFGPGGDQALDEDAARLVFARLAASLPGRATLEEIAQGFVDIAAQKMANAIKTISLQRGLNPSDFVLNCFGGAGGQHACLVADALGCERILVHPQAGVLSALGIGLANLSSVREHSVRLELRDTLLVQVQEEMARLASSVTRDLVNQGVAVTDVVVDRQLALRYAGADTALWVAFGEKNAMLESFRNQHRQRFGFDMTRQKVVVETARAEAIGGANDYPQQAPPVRSEGAPAGRPARVFLAGQWRETGFYSRRELLPGDRIAAPAVVVDDTAATVVEPGWAGRIDTHLNLILERSGQLRERPKAGLQPNPVYLEIFNNLFMHVAEQMGAVLRNTAHSVNIKERLDFSCAVFDADAGLVANAPHMPVHLGSMGKSVAVIRDKRRGQMQPGDVYVLNAPYDGGTHLPDITVITPMFDGGSADPVFYVASRGHHADIGGLTPGSMPPDSRHIDEEGILIEDFRLVEGGRLREAAVRELLASGPFPARNADQNMADLRAQIAANERGLRELGAITRKYGSGVVKAYMSHVQKNAARAVQRAIAGLVNGQFQCEMDNGQFIKVRIDVDRRRRRAVIDFTGTSPQQENNFNAPASICRAAVLYVFRTLVDEDIPLNEGCLEPLTIVIPQGSMLDPAAPGAVVAGNVETSQIVTDTLFGALGVLAACQGTMNNLTFGDAHSQYYETLCGGAGAGDGFDGADAVHTHMTNSRLTDPEILESRFAVRLRGFSIRRNSGGAGRYHGGNGVVRSIEFLQPMTVSILSNRRRVAPFGLAGGGAGAPGVNTLVRADGHRIALGSTAEVSVGRGDLLVIETPGGGGYGALRPSDVDSGQESAR